MSDRESDVVVVGCGIGGLAAAVAARQEGASVTVLERAPHAERGGQTRYTEAYLRMKSQHEVTDDFEESLAANSLPYSDPLLVHELAGAQDDISGLVRALPSPAPEVIGTLADEAGPTLDWMRSFGIRFDFLPTQFLTISQPRLLPVGGGLALIEALGAAAERLGVDFVYDTAAQDLILDADGAISSVVATGPQGLARRYRARSVVLACGGFEGNAEMMTRYLGPRAVFLRPVCRGAYYNRGEGIEMALRAGAAGCGEFGSYHAEPIDPRSGISEPSIFIFPYGVLVNVDGERFTDEAPGTVDAWYERVTRRIYEQPRGLAYVVLDAAHMEIPNYRLAIRTDKPPISADNLSDLAERIGVSAAALCANVDAYNAACPSGTSTPLVPDGLATTGLKPPKSHWSVPLTRAPFHAYPIISANVFTFGGLKTDEHGRVLNSQGDAMPGLYAAGEIIGLYFGNYTGATSVMKGAVFGRLAGRHAAARRTTVATDVHTASRTA